MPLTFDLSALSAPLPVEDSKHGLSTSTAHEISPFSFTIATPQESRSLGTGLVRRFAHTVGVATGVVVEKDELQCQRADDDENDQYTISPGRSMCWSVLCSNDTGKKHPNSLLGDFGHLERLPAWIHLLAGIGFLVYAILRPVLLTKEHTAAQTWTTIAAAAGSFCFLSSTAYHITAPSRRIAYFTRSLDFFAIYLVVAMGNVADYAIATRSFTNVSILSVLDGPMAAGIVCTFFFVRRGLLPSAESWNTFLGGCTLKMGLMRRSHLDLAHTGARQATSFLLAISYFVSTPSLFNELGENNASVILAIEIACFIMLALGMLIDNAWIYPDNNLAAGKGPNCLSCPSAGCVGSAHSLWHILAVLAAVKGAFSRELALSLS
jgi:predicted membrane channel-forming protein YqfA (hemolysin III family)